MSQVKFQRESRRLGELALPSGAFFLLKTWGNIVALVAILVACVSVSVASAATSDAIAVFSGDSAAYGAGTASGSPSLENAPSPWSEDQPVLESECDDLDSDSETTAASTLSLELSYQPCSLEKAPNPGKLLPAAHLRVSVSFARGPPAVV